MNKSAKDSSIMASFVDDEAEVGTTSEDEPMDAEESSAKKKKRAMISSDEDEDEDEDEDQIRKEMKGFVVVSISIHLDFFIGASSYNFQR